ncbi:MAG: hypothetical protein SGPRY_000036 [Prymnesium sp.]
MFPTAERSMFNPLAPMLTSEQQAAFKHSPALQQALRLNFEHFCSFLGLEVKRIANEEVSPGWPIGLDVLMSTWRSSRFDLSVEKCPKLLWVPHKPEPLGVENKASCNDHNYKHKRFDEYSHDHEAQRAMAWQATPGAGMKKAEAMLKRGPQIFGGVKINTKRFCSDALHSATGQGSGTTLPGNTLKATFDDDDDRASQTYEINHENACKCHACSTTAPWRSLSSMGNRYHQFILARGKRILIDRVAPTTMHGILFIDAFFWYRYFNDSLSNLH